MAYENTNPFSGFYWGNDPNINQQLRQRIALTMLAQSKNRGYPKNVGEGLTAIGDSLGEIGMMRRLEQSDLAQQEAAKAATAGLIGGGRLNTSSITPSDETTAQAQAQPPAPDRSIPPATNQMPVNTADLTPAEQTAGVVGTEPNALDAAGAVDPRPARRRAVAGIESGGKRNPYATLGAIVPSTGDRAYGKYQVMGKNIPEWTKAATGTALTPQQYLASEPAQEATFENKFGEYVDKYGDVGAAKAWYAGERGMRNPNATDVHGRLTVAGYGQDYANRLRAAGGQPTDPREAATQAIMARQQPTAPPVAAPRATDFSGLRRSDDVTAPPLDLGIKTAPQPPPVQPPVQMAQANKPDPGYVTPHPGPVSAPRVVPLSPLGQKALAVINANPNNEYVKTGPAGQIYQQEVNKQSIQQKQVDAEHAAEVLHNREMIRIREGQLATAADRQQKYDKAKEDFINGGPSAKSPSPENMARLNTPQSQQRSGIPAAPPVPVGVTPKEWAEKQAPELVKAVNAADSAIPDFADMVKVIKLAQDHPGKEWGTGATSGFTPWGTSGYDFGTVVGQLKGKNFLAGYQKLKGAGAVSEVEGTKTEQAQARLDPKGSTENFDAALLDLEITVRSDLERLQRKVNRPVTAWRVDDNDHSYAPDIGTRRGSFEYIGGNPNIPSSWRPAE